MALAYANCESYEDEGMVLVEPKISGCPHGPQFRTFFVCPDKFLFEWSWHSPISCDQEMFGSILVHGDLGSPRLDMGFRNTRTGKDIEIASANSVVGGIWSDMEEALKNQPLHLAIGAAAGFSMGAAMVVPPLLFPDLCYFLPSPAKLANGQIVGKEQQLKFDCDRVNGAMSPEGNSLTKSKVSQELWLDGVGVVRKCRTSITVDEAEMRRAFAISRKMLQEENIPNVMGINVGKMMSSVRKLSQDYGLPDFMEYFPFAGISLSKMSQTVIFKHASFNCNVDRLLTIIEQRNKEQRKKGS